MDRIQVGAEMPMDYARRDPKSGSASELILLLHGYAESGASILERLEPALPNDVVVIAPSGPFPFWKKQGAGFRVVYSWYLYDFQTDEYFVDMKPALDFLSNGITRLGLSKLPLRIIGFSQGGYLAPFLGERLPQTRQVIGLHSTYLYKELGSRLDFRTDSIVGGRDAVIDAENSRRSHAEIIKRSRGGEFFLIEGGEHGINDAAVRKTAELLHGVEV